MDTNALSDGIHTSFQLEVVVAVLEAFVMDIVVFSCLFLNDVELCPGCNCTTEQQTDVYIDQVSATNSYLRVVLK